MLSLSEQTEDTPVKRKMHAAAIWKLVYFEESGKEIKGIIKQFSYDSSSESKGRCEGNISVANFLRKGQFAAVQVRLSICRITFALNKFCAVRVRY